MSGKPSGLLVPIITPFDATTGEVAPIHLRENTRTLLDAGANGVVAAGSTGEASLLSESEFRQLLEWLRDVVPSDKWLVAGTGRESSRATVAACRAAAETGADAALVRAPCYYHPVLTQAGLLDHFRHVADESPIPLLLYNFPRYTHVPLTPALVEALSRHENVWGAKDSTGDLENFAAYRKAAPNWSLFMGSGALYYAALEMDATGAIAAVANFAAGPTAEIGTRFAQGDRSGAGVAQESVAPLHRGIVGTLGVPGVKAAMDMVGLAGGPPRLPLAPVGRKEQEQIRTLLVHSQLLTA